MDRQAVSKILKLNPSLFGSSIENSLEPKLVWLRERLGLEEPDIGLVVRASPNILRQEISHATKHGRVFYGRGGAVFAGAVFLAVLATKEHAVVAGNIAIVRRVIPSYEG